MKIKRFSARTFAEAFTKIKKELGPDAVILSSEEAAGPIRAVEVVAAIDYDAAGHRKTPPAGDVPVNITDISNELKSLKDVLHRITAAGYEIKMPPEKMKLFGFLKRQAVHEDFAVNLCEKASTVEELRNIIRKELFFGGERKNGKIVLVVGPTGVGKTTTIIKLATHAIRRDKKVALVSMDTFRIGAVQQMSIYAKVLGIPLEVVNSPKAVRSALNRHLDRDLIFIDTEGRNIRDTQYLENISCLYKTGMPVETHLLMSANSDSDFLMKASQHYGSLAIDCLGFTKIDETERLGCILNVARVFKRPVRYVTMGQRIPQDIEFVHPGRLSDLILGRDENKCVSDMQGRSQGV